MRAPCALPAAAGISRRTVQAVLPIFKHRKAPLGKDIVPLMKKKKNLSPELLLFFILIAAVAYSTNVGDFVFPNYYKEVYHLSASERAFLEVPRELPGLLCALIIAALPMFGDLKLALIAQIAGTAGMLALGLFTPAYGVMLLFLFTNSLGMHLFLPLQDSIGMALAEPGNMGRRIGQFASVRTAAAFFAGAVVFIGFKSGLFSFESRTKWVFVVAAVFSAVAILAVLLLIKRVGDVPRSENTRFRLVFRKEYKYFYMLAILAGVQKQIAYVFGSWVIVDMLLKGADVMSLLTIVGNFIGIFFMRFIGRLIDKLGIRRIMFLDALTFIVVYTLYGFAVWYVAGSVAPDTVWPALTIYALFILDRLSMQIGVIRSVYLRSIAIDPADITPTLSTGTSLDHLMAIGAAQLCGFIWMRFGPQWVFFGTAFISLGNLFIATRIPAKQKESLNAAGV